MSKQLGVYSLLQEQEVLAYWAANKIPEKVRTANHSSKQKYYFMDGPPYATGSIHMGTALNKTLKDVAIRSRRMQGFHVFDRPGYDTHGVPIEHKVEQLLGFNSKKDIEGFGVGNFVQKCKDFATQHIDTMNAEFNDLGVWMDWENPYLTLSPDYIEAIWYTFKKADEKGLLYLGSYPIHACMRCETAVAFNEIEYEKQTDNAVYVKFPLVNEKNTFLVIWTTTPWSIPGVMGIMANPKLDYVKVQVGNEVWILAKARLENLMNHIKVEHTILETFKGKTLENIPLMNPISKFLNFKKEDLMNAYRVVLTERYVSADDGTGLVTCAPGHGKEDYSVGKENDLPIVCPVGLNGLMTAEAGKYQGKQARIVDAEIVADLKELNALVAEEKYTHDYPKCWRCKTALILITAPQWFFNIKKIQPKLLSENETVNWKPEWMKDRMRNWLQSLGDWPVSRKRYWGAPLPIWVCDSCKSQKVIGSIEELKKETGLKEIKDIHKPWIDSVFLKCKCSGKMTRVPEVLDVWFDSGVSSWGALMYPQSEKLWKDFWPADFNVEGTDQVRGWWNSQMITSVITFDSKPFKNVMTHGMVLDLGKKKMSKSKGNVIQPKEVIEKYNRDYLRYYFVKESQGTDIVFDWKMFEDVKRFFNTLSNSLNYAALYLDFSFTEHEPTITAKLQTEDQWLLSRLTSVTEKVLQSYNSYTFFEGMIVLEKFVVEDLSRTYIKLIRDRVNSNSREAVQQTLSYVLNSVFRLLSPVTPHLTEYAFIQLRTPKAKESIHLLSLPQVNSKFLNPELEQEFALMLSLTQAFLSAREEAKLRLRWPLECIAVESTQEFSLKHTQELLARAVNVKKIIIGKPSFVKPFVKMQEQFTLSLETFASPELENEWEFRELVRLVQDQRKQAKLIPGQVVELELSCSDSNFLKTFGKQLEQETSTKIVSGKGEQTLLLKKSFYYKLKV
ncbi:MAG: isoleucine--tRNA ligase [Candidatus Diapherotrites archaeon]|nr:isoleucine--tRNA ligase [Candidatus Diapherotrites archaeon]